MNEEERAEWLARAIDDLLNSDRQRPKEPPPPRFEREELNALLRIASARAEAADSELQSGVQYEGEVWQHVLKRLDRRKFPRDVRPFDTAQDDAEWERLLAGRRLDEMEIDELRGIAQMRRQMAEQAASLGEELRDEVWQRIQNRLQDRARTRFRFRRRKEDHERLAEALDRTAAGEKVLPTGDPDFDSLVEIARERARWSRQTRKAAVARGNGIWIRISAAVRGRLLAQKVGRRAGWWRKPALAVAAAAGLAVIAVAPLPATGFADHPVTRAVRSLAEHVGVREAGEPPSGFALDSAKSFPER